MLELRSAGDNTIIIDVQEVSEFDFKLSNPNAMNVVEEYSMSSMLVEGELLMYPRILGLDIQGRIFTNGAFFDNSGIITVFPSGGFDCNTYKYRYKVLISSPASCHGFRVYERSVPVSN